MGRNRRNRMDDLSGDTNRIPPKPGSPAIEFTRWLGYAGEILVLFETPSGFALFNYNGSFLYSPKAIEKIWSDFATIYAAQEVIVLKDFQIFKNKAAAITSVGVDAQLSKMLQKCLLPRQKLAVGKAEYKEIIQSHCEVTCLFDEAVMELMWGIKHLIKFLVPDEAVDLTVEDRLPMSQGLLIMLRNYGFDVKPEEVHEEMIQMAFALYECNLCEKRHDETLKRSASILNEVSGIDTENWSPLKIASALKIISYPEENFQYAEILSDDEISTLVAEAPKFEGKFLKKKCLGIYNAIVRANIVRIHALKKLKLRLMIVRQRKGSKEVEVEEGEDPRFPGRAQTLGSAGTEPTAREASAHLHARLLDNTTPSDPLTNTQHTAVNTVRADATVTTEQVDTFDEELKKLVGMGFEKTQAEVALAAADGDPNVAIEILMSQQG